MIRIYLLAATAALAAPLALAVPAQADGGVFVASSNIAVGGYDAVSYFQGDGVPLRGDARYVIEHDGAKFHFASQANADAFAADPAAFAPQYGGHCAWAMAQGSLAPADPTLYKVVDGKLYLNYNADVQQTWLGDVDGFIASADSQWSNIPDGQHLGG